MGLSPLGDRFFLQTLPVGSLVYSVLAEDKDTGSSGIVEYNLTEVGEGPR